MEKAWISPEGPAYQWNIKFGGGSLMFWGCMPAQGVNQMCTPDGRIDTELYTSIHQDEFLATGVGDALAHL
jgi:hypothetical protein